MKSTEALLQTVGIRAVEGFGISVHAGTLDQHLEIIDLAINENCKITVYDNMNLHSLYFYLKYSTVRKAHEDAIVMIDSIPIAILMKILGRPVELDHRVTGCDFVWPFLRQVASADQQLFCLGNAQKTVDAALAVIKKRVPGIRIDGRHGFFDKAPGSSESSTIIEEINQLRPDLLTVGFGSPLEQRWIAAHRHLIDAPVVVAWGACLEYVGGTVSTPPRWMGRWGLEWSYRLASNPRRFAHRYLVEPWALIALLIRHNLARSRSGKRA